MKTCSRCKKELPEDSFHKNNAAKDKLKHCCKQCDKDYLNENYCLVNGYRLMIDWSYTDPYSGDLIILPKDIWLTQPFSNAEHRSALYIGVDLLVPRSLVRRSRTTVRKAVRDDILLGKLEPTVFWDHPCEGHTPKET